MTEPSREDARRWMREGTELFVAALPRDEAEASGPSALPGWSRRHVVAHTAANADALRNLVTWAATGVPTPMYASDGDRAAGIERGALLGLPELRSWLSRSVVELDTGLDALSEDQWRARVVTAQGRELPAAEIPWLRAREVSIHAVDLATSASFADLSSDFLQALCGDVIAKRSGASEPALVLVAADADRRWELGEGEPTVLQGSLAEISAYLTGRDHRLTTVSGEPAPELAAWL